MSLNNAIHSSHPLLYLLYPISLVFRSIATIRRYLYQKGIFTQTKIAVPVIIVGNISVGGTGKTPLVIALAHTLRQQGFKPGVIIRGYKSKITHYPCQVNATHTAQQVGDEALLLYKHSGCPVIVDPNRVRACQYLLQHTACDIILSDDGLQHYALARDIEIAVVDATRGFGNKMCLPAGPLREPVSRLNQVDFVLCNSIAAASHPNLLPGLPGRRSFNVPVYPVFFVPQYFYNVCTKERRDIRFFANKTLHAVAGIGNPQRFFASLSALGLDIIPHAFPDHHAFVSKDIDFGSGTLIIMTEKDAVKCQDFADERHWYLSIDAHLPSEFVEALINKLSILRQAQDA